MSFDRMKWVRIAGLSLALTLLVKNEAVSEKNGDIETTMDLSSALEGNSEEFSSSLYEMVPHNVTFLENSRRLSQSADRVVFYAMGDTPYGVIQKRRFPFQMQALDSRAEFVIHLGDMKVRNPDLCTGDEYQQVSTMLQESKAPVLIVPGDNGTHTESLPQFE